MLVGAAYSHAQQSRQARSGAKSRMLLEPMVLVRCANASARLRRTLLSPETSATLPSTPAEGWLPAAAGAEPDADEPEAVDGCSELSVALQGLTGGAGFSTAVALASAVDRVVTRDAISGA